MAQVFQYQPYAEPFVPTAAPTFPDLSWHPTYPDAVRASQLLPSLVTALFFVVGAVVPDAVVASSPWYPSYPSSIERPSMPSQEQQSLAYTNNQADYLNVLGWFPFFADQVPGLAPMKTADRTVFCQGQLENFYTIAAPDYAIGRIVVSIGY